MTVKYTIESAPSPSTLLKDPIICLWNRGGGQRCRDVLKRDTLSSHLHSVHGCRGADDTTLLCWWDGCAESMEKGAIVKHIEAVHLGVIYPCRPCNVTFAGKRSFELHLLGCPVRKKRGAAKRAVTFERLL